MHHIANNMQSPYRPTTQRPMDGSRNSFKDSRPAVPPSYNTAMAKKSEHKTPEVSSALHNHIPAAYLSAMCVCLCLCICMVSNFRNALPWSPDIYIFASEAWFDIFIYFRIHHFLLHHLINLRQEIRGPTVLAMTGYQDHRQPTKLPPIVIMSLLHRIAKLKKFKM